MHRPLAGPAHPPPPAVAMGTGRGGGRALSCRRGNQPSPAATTRPCQPQDLVTRVTAPSRHPSTPGVCGDTETRGTRVSWVSPKGGAPPPPISPHPAGPALLAEATPSSQRPRPPRRGPASHLAPRRPTRRGVPAPATPLGFRREPIGCLRRHSAPRLRFPMAAVPLGVPVAPETRGAGWGEGGGGAAGPPGPDWLLATTRRGGDWRRPGPRPPGETGGSRGGSGRPAGAAAAAEQRRP